MDRSVLRLSLSCAALCIMALPASAQATLEFSGTASASCTLTGGTAGVFDFGADAKSFTTQTPATLQIANAGQWTLTVARSGSWKTKPGTAPSGTVFAHTASLTGENTGAVFAGDASKSTVLTNPGSDELSVSMTATNAKMFQAGDYVTEVTVTCAPAGS